MHKNDFHSIRNVRPSRFCQFRLIANENGISLPDFRFRRTLKSPIFQWGRNEFTIWFWIFESMMHTHIHTLSTAHSHSRHTRARAHTHTHTQSLNTQRPMHSPKLRIEMKFNLNALVAFTIFFLLLTKLPLLLYSIRCCCCCYWSMEPFMCVFLYESIPIHSRNVQI